MKSFEIFAFSFALLVAVNLVQAACVPGYYCDENLWKEYKKIDKYLASELPKEASLDEIASKIQEWDEKQEKRSPFKNYSLRPKYDRNTLIPLYLLGDHRAKGCLPTIRAIEDADVGLGKYMQDSWVHLERFIDESAKILAQRCYSRSLLDDFKPINRIFYRAQYDRIEELLKEHPNANMETVKELSEMNHEDPRLQDAVKTLVKLEKLDQEDQVACDQEEYDALFWNELAVRHKDKDYSDRLINKLVEHYSTRHASICRNRNMERFESEMQTLEPEKLDYLAIVPNKLLYFLGEPLELKLPIASYQDLRGQLMEAHNLDVIRGFNFERDPEFSKTTYGFKTFHNIISSLMKYRALPVDLHELLKDRHPNDLSTAAYNIIFRELLLKPCDEINAKLRSLIEQIERDNLALDGRMHFDVSSPATDATEVMLNYMRMAVAWCRRASSKLDEIRFIINVEKEKSIDDLVKLLSGSE